MLVCIAILFGVTHSRTLKVDGALTENQSFRANGSVRFFRPFLPFDKRLFFPTAIFAWKMREKSKCCAVGAV